MTTPSTDPGNARLVDPQIAGSCWDDPTWRELIGVERQTAENGDKGGGRAEGNRVE
jgi:hypothetical protein